MINLDNENKEILHNILKKYPYKFFAYGSRVKGTNKKFSDLDLCFMNHLTDLETQNLREEFEESNLKIKINLAKWCYFNENFCNTIKIRFG